MTLALVSGNAPLDFVTIGNAERLAPLHALALGQNRFVAHLDGGSGNQSARNILAARLDRLVAESEARVMLIAEGTGCFAAAWWARLTPASYVSRVAGALFYAPLANRDAAGVAAGQFASPRTRLPFPSLLLDDREALAEGATGELASSWGSRPFGLIVDAPSRWTRARRMVTKFTSHVVELDTLRAEKLRGLR